MRVRGWVKVVVLLLVAGAFWLLHDHRLEKAEQKIRLLERDVEQLNSYLPALLRTELSAHEQRMLDVLEARGK